VVVSWWVFILFGFCSHVWGGGGELEIDFAAENGKMGAIIRACLRQKSQTEFCSMSLVQLVK